MQTQIISKQLTKLALKLAEINVTNCVYLNVISQNDGTEKICESNCENDCLEVKIVYIT